MQSADQGYSTSYNVVIYIHLYYFIMLMLRIVVGLVLFIKDHFLPFENLYAIFNFILHFVFKGCMIYYIAHEVVA